MFFVINDFGNINLEEKKRLIEDILPRRLGPLFGDDTSLFSRRVFFVNVQNALEARLAGESDEILEETGLLAFERTLLDAEERRHLIRQAATRPLTNEEKSEAERTASVPDPEIKSDKDALANVAAEKRRVETERKRDLVPNQSDTKAEKVVQEAKETPSPEPARESTEDEDLGPIWIGIFSLSFVFLLVIIGVIGIFWLEIFIDVFGFFGKVFLIVATLIFLFWILSSEFFLACLVGIFLSLKSVLFWFLALIWITLLYKLGFWQSVWELWSDYW